MSFESNSAHHPSIAADCLLISCTYEKDFLMREFELRSDIVDCVSQAIPLLERSFRERSPYRLILFDFDDPTIFIGRIVRTIETLLAKPGNERVIIDVYACSDDSSIKVRKKVSSRKLQFLSKPLTRENCLTFATRYPPSAAMNL